MDSSAPAICRLRATAPISISVVWSKPCGAGLLVTGATFANVTVSLPSLARLSPASIWHFAVSTRAIEMPPAPCASTAMCLASLAKGTPRARPDRVPSALSAMRSRGLAGATVIGPSGDVIFACSSSHPASMVSASGTAMAKRPAALRTEKPSARLAPEPPHSSDTHASGRPASVSACHSGAFQSPFLSRLMVWASARSAKIFSAVSATMFSLSATAFLVFVSHTSRRRFCPGSGCGLFLRRMMRKSHRHDKRRCPQRSLQGPHEAAIGLIPRNGVLAICRHIRARYGRSVSETGWPTWLAGNQKRKMRMSGDGLCAIVTGSASGLGAATAAILAKGGARLVVNYSSSQKEAEQTADLCRAAGGEVVVVQGDVSRDEDCKKIVAAAAPWGRLDALINNAGTTKHMAHGNLDGLSAEDFQRLFGVNTIGPFQMVRAARSLLEAGAKASGRASAVVNVSSVAGISGIGSSIAYAASKGALNTITYSLARALAPLIRVNTVCPGYIDTPWFTKGRGEEAGKQVRDAVVAKVPLKRASTAEDVAELVCFLATPSSSNMTGELVRMDAGLHLIT